MNLRQDRSSMYMTYAGNNFMTYLIDDLLFDYQGDYYNHNKSHLWYSTSHHVLSKYATERIKPKVHELFKQGKYNFSLDYASDANLKRRWLFVKRKLSTTRYFPTYAENLKR